MNTDKAQQKEGQFKRVIIIYPISSQLTYYRTRT